MWELGSRRLQGGRNADQDSWNSRWIPFLRLLGCGTRSSFIAKDRCDTGHFDHITCLKFLPTSSDLCIIYSDLDVLPSTNDEVPVLSLLNRSGGTRSEPPLQPNAGHLRLSDHAELA